MMTVIVRNCETFDIHIKKRTSMRLTKATTESVCEAIENGHAVRFACAFAGVSQ